jgi:hypothetical protein
MQLFKVEAGAKIADSTGSVRVIRDGLTVYVKAGDALQEGDVVVIGRADKVVLSSENGGDGNNSLLTDNGVTAVDSSSLGDAVSESYASNFVGRFFSAADAAGVSSVLTSILESNGYENTTLNSLTFKSHLMVSGAHGGFQSIGSIVDGTSTVVASVYQLAGKGTVIAIDEAALGKALVAGASESISMSGLTSMLSTSSTTSSTTSSGSTNTATSNITSSQTININVILGNNAATWVYGTSGDDYYQMLNTGKNLVDLLDGNDIIVTSSASFRATDIVMGGTGFDTLVFTNAANINASVTNAGVWANKSGIDAIQLNGDGNVLNMALYYQSDSGSLIIYNQGFTVSSLKAWDFTHVVIAGTGLINLGSGVNNTIYLQEGLDANIGLTDWTYWIHGGSGDETYYATNGILRDGYLFAADGYDTITYQGVVNQNAEKLDQKTGIDALKFTANGNQIGISDELVANSDSGFIDLLNQGFTISSLNTSTVVSGQVYVAGTGAVTMANPDSWGGLLVNVVYGKDGVNTNVIGSYANNTFYGGTGNDSYTFGHGIDTVNLGAGNDFIIYSESAISSSDRVDGGAGFDTLKIAGAGEFLNLVASSNDVFSSIEGIDINGIGGNFIYLNAADILALSQETDVVFIRGGADDQVGLAVGDTWANAGNFTVNGVNYVKYISGSAEIYAQSGLQVDTNFVIANNSYTLTAGTDNFSSSVGDDRFITTNANFNASDILNGGLGRDTLEFLDAANITAANFINKSRIDVIKLNADGNIINLDLNYLSDTAELEINNQSYTVTSLSARQGTNVKLSGTGQVTLKGDTNNYLTVKDGVNASIVLAGAMYSVYGGTGNETYYVTDANLKSVNTLSAGSGTDKLILLNSLSMTAQDIQNVTGVEIIRLGGDNNSLFFTDAFVNSSSSDSIELQNLGYTISLLDTSSLIGDSKVVIAGTGAVYLADGANNTVYAKDQVNINLFGGTGDDTYSMGTGVQTVNLGAGNDTVLFNGVMGLTAGSVIDGGASSEVFGEGNALYFSRWGYSVDFTSVDDGMLKNFQLIDMSVNGMMDTNQFDSANSVIMTSADVLALADSSHSLFIRGSAADYLGLVDGWTKSQVFAEDGVTLIDQLVTIGDYQYYIYTSNVDEAVIYVQPDVNVQIGALSDFNQTVSLTAGDDTVSTGIGNDVIETTNANFNAGDDINAGLGADTLRFLDAANVTDWYNFSIDRIELNANGNIFHFDSLFRSDSGALVIDNANYTIDELRARAESNVIIGGSGRVNLAGGFDSTIYAAIGVDTHIGLSGWTAYVYGNSGNDTYYVSSAGVVGNSYIYSGAGYDVMQYDYQTASWSDNPYIFENKTGIDALHFTHDGNSLVIGNSIVANSDQGILELLNDMHSIDGLNTSLVNSAYHVVIAGTGAVTLGNPDSWGNVVTNVVYGKDGINTHVIGSQSNSVYYGGTGDDTYELGTGKDTINLGAGDDVFKVSADDRLTNTDSIHGGSDSAVLGLGDVLELVGSGQHLDLTALNNNVIQGIEQVDLTGTGNNTLSLNVNDLLALSGSTDDLIVKGNVGDTVNLITSAGHWTQNGDQVINGVTYHVYDSATVDDARALIDANIQVVIS